MNDNYTPPPEEYAAIYARKSTLLENNSINSQVEIAKRKLSENGLFLYDVYSDEESATRYHPLHRQGFKKLLYYAKKGKFKTVVVYRRDRLARRVEHLLEIKKIFKKLGITIIYSNEGEFQPNDSYFSNFIENIIMAVDELEPSILSERIISGMQEKKLRGEYSKRATYGYISPEKNGTKEYTHDKAKAEIIKEIFDLFLALPAEESIYDKIHKKINAKISNKNEKLRKQFIKDRILNPIYAGLIRLDSSIPVLSTVKKNGNKELIVDDSNYISCTNLTGIIKKKPWFKAVIKYYNLSPERNSLIDDESSYLFKGLIYCKKCNKPLHLVRETYRCMNGCTLFNKHELENVLLRKILKEIVTHDNIRCFHENNFRSLEEEIESIEKEITDIKKSQEDTIKTLIKNYSPNSTDTLAELLGKLKVEKETIEKFQNKQDKKDIREKAVKALLVLEELDFLKENKSTTAIISELRKNVEYSNILLKDIIEKIKVKGKKKVDLYDNANTDITCFK